MDIHGYVRLKTDSRVLWQGWLVREGVKNSCDSIKKCSKALQYRKAGTNKFYLLFADFCDCQYRNKRDAQRQYVVIGTLAPILLNFYLCYEVIGAAAPKGAMSCY